MGQVLPFACSAHVIGWQMSESGKGKQKWGQVLSFAYSGYAIGWLIAESGRFSSWTMALMLGGLCLQGRRREAKRVTRTSGIGISPIRER